MLESETKDRMILNDLDENLLKDLEDQWGRLVEISDSEEVLKTYNEFLDQVVSAGQDIEGIFARERLQSFAREIADAIYWHQKAYPSAIIKPFKSSAERKQTDVPEILYQSNPHFTGRLSILEHIRNKFNWQNDKDFFRFKQLLVLVVLVKPKP
jgi:hypothetical protein